MPDADTNTDTRARLGELAAVFLKLGTIGFGGPAAHIALMEDELVRRRGWLTREQLLDLVGAANLIPGPNSTEVAIHVGRLRAGLPGLIVAGTSFILPAFFIVTAIGWAYQRAGRLPATAALLHGIKPVMIAIVLQALIGLGHSAIKSWPLALAGAAALIAALLRPLDEVAILLIVGLGAGVIAWLRTRGRGGPGASTRAWGLGPRTPSRGSGPSLGARPNDRGSNRGADAAPRAFGLGVGVGLGPTLGFRPRLPLPFTLPLSWPSFLATSPMTQAAVVLATPVALWPLFLVFAKAGALLFGSGYVLLAFLRADLVERLHWLTNAQLLDAIAVGQVTPGPVFTTATFIGYNLAGLRGAIVATVGIFLPAFIFVAASGPLIPAMRRSRIASAVLDGVNVASLALMVAVTMTLAQDALTDVTTILIAAISALLLFRYRVNATILIAAGAIIGLLVR